MTAAFSEHNPRLQLAWDSSSLKNYQFCPRFYQYTNLEGWQTENVNLVFGRLFASGLERYQKMRLDGSSKEDAVLAVARWALEATYNEDGTQWGGSYADMWKCDGTGKYKNEKGNRAVCPYAFKAFWAPGAPPDQCPACHSPVITSRQYVPDDQKKNRQTLVRALIQYGLDQPDDLADGLMPYVFSDGTMAVELSGRMPLPWRNTFGEQYILTWNFDYIGVFGDEKYIVDNKTTAKSLDDKFFDAYSPDTQFDNYDLIASIAFPALDIKGMMIDAVQMLVGGFEFGRRAYAETETQREEHLADLRVWLNDAEHSALTGYWRMNKRNCWLCPFKQVCSQAPENREAFLKNHFNKGPVWDTLQER